MASRSKCMDLDKIPGAKENHVKWLMASGVRTAKDARKAAKAFIDDLKKIKKKTSSKHSDQ